jgi:light-regulated signal transduction histidine kinase (bacteriophytochrome)
MKPTPDSPSREETVADKMAYDELLDLAAHDLQAPLRKLSVLTDRFISKFAGADSTEAREYSKRMMGCVHDMQQMINGILELSNLNTYQKNISSCDLNEAVQQALKILGESIREKKAVIEIAQLETIEADAGQMNLLFKHLIENSLKFSGETSLQINISGRTATDDEKEKAGLANDEPFYSIQLSDNGIGFDEENARKIFQPMVRLNGKSGYPGNGLGLTLCEKIVSGHGGSIYAERIENNGARFILLLPKKQKN